MTTTATTTRPAETWAHMLAEVDPMPVCVALDFAQEGVTFEDARAAVEAVAQQHLDAHPDDHGARRLLGEWLTACGDDRGAGLTALGVCGKWCRYWSINQAWCWLRDVTAWYRAEFEHTELGGDWYDAGIPIMLHSFYDTRQAAEDAAAKAFLRLPEARRVQLLKGEM